MDVATKYWIRRIFLIVGLGAVLKILLGIKLVDFGLVVSGWMFFGRLITLDDELPGGFNNPDGDQALPKFELAGLGLAFAGMVILKLWIVGG
jgi:hypothetical protein